MNEFLRALSTIVRPTPRRGGYRHLVYFIDGTWLWPGSDKSLDVYSNIYLLNTLLNSDGRDGHAQIVHYVRGLGAVDGIRKYTAGGFSYGIDALIADLYINICSNYEPGDKIYIFGFSRGAVVARALSGLLSMGILDAAHINLFSHVWGRYEGSGEVRLPGTPRDYAAGSIPVIDYDRFCANRHPTIEFLGVFDTVAGGHGPSEVAQRLRLSQGNLQPNVKHAVHILSIDESRSFFKPVFWTGRGFDPRYGFDPAGTLFEQIWMPGVHSDVGGAYTDRYLGNRSLITMIDRVIAKTDLGFDVAACANVRASTPIGGVPRIHDERTKWWRILDPFPRGRRPGAPEHHALHPFAERLHRQPVFFKREPTHRPYPLHEAFTSLPVAPEFISDAFRSWNAA